MKNYLPFISDSHLIECIGNLHNSYLKAQQSFTLKKFYKNKVDTIKLTFDKAFNEISEENLIQSEILRQIDKSINNSIGTFHEQVLGGINGYSSGFNKGFDVKAIDNSLFADVKNKHNTMNSSSSEALFQKLARYADDNKSAKCYWVQIWAKSSFCEHWQGDINGKEYSHSRVFKISGDQFYALLAGYENAFYDLYKVLPTAIEDYLNSKDFSEKNDKSSVLEEIKIETKESHRTILNQITFDNFSYYNGFEEL